MPGAFLQKTLSCVVVSQKGLPRWLSGKEPACQHRRRMFNLWSRRSPAEGNDNALQYPCLGNSMNREAWQTTVHRVTKSGTRLSD